MKPENFAQAVFELEQQGVAADAIVQGLSHTLQRRGMRGLLPNILSSYRKLKTHAQSDAHRLTVAREKDADVARKESGAPKDTSVDVDERLIGGYRLLGKGKLLDNSYKAHLLELYRKVKQNY